MTTGITDPITGKTYTYTGFTPQRRIAESCAHGSHASCKSGHQDLIQNLGFELTKKICCLCQCHFEGEGK